MQVTRTPADVLATLSRRYREHYGDRLVGIYAVPELPFSDEGPEETEDDDVRAIEILVILQGPYDHFEETDPVVDIAMDVTEEYDWGTGGFARHAARDSDRAEGAECKGIVV
ncbi:hypothetical protein [Salinibacter ruber]|uniref:Uncharacterized protein n=1 Tax=Salinibacter ruber TaxID=146919 RepID=A0AAW5PAF4_9BACT|nr:hypothetical protein [Salinibacter ruber]MCS4158900.1 hypothetical protein [Salinibacter ruber]MCS4223050.1 hypothetical protein [Salinibacter ruber]